MDEPKIRPKGEAQPQSKTPPEPKRGARRADWADQTVEPMAAPPHAGAPQRAEALDYFARVGAERNPDLQVVGGDSATVARPPRRAKALDYLARVGRQK